MFAFLGFDGFPMLPLTLDLGRLRLALVGEGEPALKRLQLLDAAGARALTVYAVSPSPELAAAAGTRLERRAPRADELAACHIVFIAGLDDAARDRHAAAARAAAALVHVEDAPLLSDAQAPAVLRRGDLTIAISTAGKSPGVAVALKHWLGRLIGPEWRDRLEQAAARRRSWREAGLAPAAVAQRTEEYLAASGWLPEAAPAPAAPSVDDRGEGRVRHN